MNASLRHQLDTYATRYGLTESSVVQQALTNHFEGPGDPATRDKEKLYDRLDNMSRTIDRAGNEVGELRADICELRQHVVAQGQLLQMLVPTFLSLGQLLPADKLPGKAPGLPAALRDLYQALAQRVAKDRTLLHDLPAEVREHLEDEVAQKRWSVQPAQDDDARRAASSARPDEGGDARRAASTLPDEGDDSPEDDDVWLDTEPDDDHG